MEDFENFKRLNPFIIEELENMDFKKILTNEQMEDRYKTDAIEVFDMHVIHKPEEIDDPKHTFKPEFMHHYFGDQETIVGYMDPEIEAYFTPGSMHCYLKIEFEDKKPEAEELKKPFEEFFLQGYVEDPEEFNSKKFWKRTEILCPLV